MFQNLRKKNGLSNSFEKESFGIISLVSFGTRATKNSLSVNASGKVTLERFRSYYVYIFKVHFYAFLLERLFCGRNVSATKLFRGVTFGDFQNI